MLLSLFILFSSSDFLPELALLLLLFEEDLLLELPCFVQLIFLLTFDV